jgi:hypothetical protein
MAANAFDHHKHEGDALAPDGACRLVRVQRVGTVRWC